MGLALFPGLWINLFTSDANVFSSGASYLKIVGPAFLFQGLGLSLYFASPGTRAVFCPVIATIVRFGIADAGVMLGIQWFGLGGNFIFGCIVCRHGCLWYDHGKFPRSRCLATRKKKMTELVKSSSGLDKFN